MDIFGYIRVSLVEQGDSGNGLAAQRSAIEAKALARGWTIKGWYQDIASGKSLHRRPQLLAALRLLKERQADGLVVAKLDRLSRSQFDFSSLLETSRRQGWKLVALDADIDTTTSTGELVAGVIIQAAQFERRRIGERTKEAMAIVKRNGPRPGKKVIGRPRLISDVLEHQIRKMRGRGRSLREIALQLNDEGVPAPCGGRWIHTSVARVVARG